MKFNVNDKVRVRLTDYGRQCLADNYHRLSVSARVPISAPNPTPDDEGWTEWQLWTLMQEFGPHMRMGSAVPFETTVELVPPNAALSGSGSADSQNNQSVEPESASTHS